VVAGQRIPTDSLLRFWRERFGAVPLAGLTTLNFFVP